ncbi:MAG: IS4 family transposase [Rubrivivax sp.]|nr:IS4 family transposase [Rubrivivax sp.]
MDDELDADDAMDGDVEGLDALDLAGFGGDWEVVAAMLPVGWQAKAVELGAVRRQLRGFEDVASLLRVLLIHLADGCSLRETAVRASAGGLAAVSDVALLKRLRSCGGWFEWMVRQLACEMALSLGVDAPLAGRRVRLIDGSSVCEPGATGSTWRLHYALNLRTLSCEEVHVTDASVAESLSLFEIRSGDVIMADRGFARRGGVRWALQHQADVLLRTGLTSVPLRGRHGMPLQALQLLRTLEIGRCGEWPARIEDGTEAIEVRMCAYKKTAAQTQAAVKAIELEARKKGRQPAADTLEAAGYVIVLTTLAELPAQNIMELYRLRWQVELAFKRLKSLLQLGHLKKFDRDGARAWLQGKLLVACLIEKLILTAERFSPWGYVTPGQPRAQPAIAVA